MSDLMKFMMMIIALAFISFLNADGSREKRGETNRSLIIAPDKKLPV